MRTLLIVTTFIVAYFAVGFFLAWVVAKIFEDDHSMAGAVIAITVFVGWPLAVPGWVTTFCWMALQDAASSRRWRRRRQRELAERAVDDTTQSAVQ